MVVVWYAAFNVLDVGERSEADASPELSESSEHRIGSVQRDRGEAFADEGDAALIERSPPSAEAALASLVDRHYADAEILVQQTRHSDEAGYRQRVRLLQTDLKYPLVRVEDRFHSDDAGHAELVASTAMAGGHLLLEASGGLSQAELRDRLAEAGFSMRETFAFSETLLLEIPEAATDIEAFERTRTQVKERFDASIVVEPDYIVYPEFSPNDPGFRAGDLWGLHNTGQDNGVAGADISAVESWTIRNDAESVIVGVVDTGIRLSHADLVDNLWVNPDEIADGTDTSGSGIVDDIHGFDAIEDSGNPDDETGHGTHVAGTIGAVGDNAIGVTGVAWNVQLMALRFLTADGGFTSDAIRSIDYARVHGADILNNSWGGTGRSVLLRNAIGRADDAGILFVAAAGNQNRDNDEYSIYPASYDLDNIVSVASSTRRDQRSFFSNYGPQTVDLAAPGSSIVSTYNHSDNGYAILSGTSMAAPFASGSAAILRAEFPLESALEIKNRMIESVDPLPAFAGRTVSGGRLNLYAALQDAELQRPGMITFATDAVSVPETGEEVAVLVDRIGGTDGDVSVRIETVDGTAVAGVHYAAVDDATLAWDDGDGSERVVNVAILEDPDTTDPVSFTLQLSESSGGAVIDHITVIEITVLDQGSVELDGYAFEETVALDTREFYGGADPHVAVAPDGSYAVAVSAFEDEVESGLRAPELKLLRLSVDGSTLWSREHMSGQGAFQPKLAVTPEGGLVVAYARITELDETVPVRADISLARFDAEGELLWDRILPGASSHLDMPQAIRMHAEDAIYVGGERNFNGKPQPYLARLNGEGELVWNDTDPPEGRAGVETVVHDLDLDTSGNLYAGGWTIGDAGIRVGLLQKYHADGERLFVREYAADGPQRLFSLVVNVFDEVFLGLRSFTASETYNGKLFRVSAYTGEPVWQRVESLGEVSNTFHLSASPNGFINYAAAAFALSTESSSLRIGQYNREGGKRFSNHLETNNPVTLRAMTGRGDGGILLSGGFNGLAQFGPAFLDSDDEVAVYLSRLNLQDDLVPGLLEFEGEQFSVLESIGSMEVLVRRIEGFDGEISVKVDAVGLTAVAGEDFAPIEDHELVLAPGQQSVSFEVGILENFVAGEQRAFELRLSDPTGGAGIGEKDTAEVTILESGSGYQAWVRQFFDDDQLADPEVSADAADPTGDGLSNLVKYAFGLDPTVPTAPPEIRVVAVDDALTTLRYLRGRDRDDLRLDYYGSTDLEQWQLLQAGEEVIVPLEETDLEEVEVPLQWPLAATDPRFVRIVIERAREGISD